MNGRLGHYTDTPDLGAIMENSRLLTVKQVAKYLAICERTAWNLVNDGKLPTIRFGRVVRVDQADVDAFINSIKGVRNG